MIKSIPKKFLIHDVIYKKENGMDRDRNLVFLSTQIKFVRVIPNYQIAKGQYANEQNDGLTLYADTHNTRFFDLDTKQEIESVEFRLNDFVEFMGKDYCITGIHPCYTKGTKEIHHIEVSLK